MFERCGFRHFGRAQHDCGGPILDLSGEFLSGQVFQQGVQSPFAGMQGGF
jgi:hypothetical protein